MTQEQIDAMNRQQRDIRYHPYTCGSGRRTNQYHLDGEGVLIATPSGWVCPYCDYRQPFALIPSPNPHLSSHALNPLSPLRAHE